MGGREGGKEGGVLGRSITVLPVPASYQDALMYIVFQMLGLSLWEKQSSIVLKPSG